MMVPKRQLSRMISLPGLMSLPIFLAVAMLMTWRCEPNGSTINPLTDFLAEMGIPDLHFVPVADKDGSFGLAYNQSLGFFDDIRDSDWKIAQRLHAKAFPNHFTETPNRFSSKINDKGNRKALNMAPEWYAENFQEEFHCAYSQRIPSDSNGDGPKWVCDPHRLAKKNDCLIYSVGSNGNTMFEEGIKREIGEHCEIHTFDMVTYNKRNGHFQPKLEAVGAYFHAWGLGTREQAENYTKTKKGQPMYTLKQTMAMLNHTGRVLDIFKIDCEWCEWHTYKDWLEAGDLRQILIETHNAPMPNAMDFFYTLHDAGYVIFSKEANFVNRGGGVEYAFLKLSPEFFINDSMYSKAKTETIQELTF